MKQSNLSFIFSVLFGVVPFCYSSLP